MAKEKTGWAGVPYNSIGFRIRDTGSRFSDTPNTWQNLLSGGWLCEMWSPEHEFPNWDYMDRSPDKECALQWFRMMERKHEPIRGNELVPEHDASRLH